MALISCNECGRQVSDKASQCPGCGAPIREKEGIAGVLLPRSKNAKTEINWPLRIGIAVIILLMWLFFHLATQ